MRPLPPLVLLAVACLVTSVASNDDVNNTPPVRTDTPDTLSASKVVDVPLRSDGKLRCDCQGIWRCRSDRGKRRKAHCVVHYGWCATKAQAHPFAVAVNFAINLPPLTIRFCTLNYSECAAGSRKDSNTLCCNNRRFCNEALSPKLAIISPHYTTASAEVPTTSIQQLPSLHTPEADVENPEMIGATTQRSPAGSGDVITLNG